MKNPYSMTQSRFAEKNKAIRKERMRLAREKGRHTKEEWEALKEEFGFRCVICGMDELRVEKDHIVPVCAGGSDGIDNIQPACARCNASKTLNTTDYKEYRRKFGFE